MQIIALANQKGGVGKTTSTINLGAELAFAGKKVLIVDFDPQGSATSGLGVEIPEEGKDLFDIFFESSSLKSIILETSISNLMIAPASKDLVSIEIEVGKAPGRELVLKSELSLLNGSFDYVLIDCPPSSGLLTLNALGASQNVLIPLQAEYYALEGLSALMETINFTKGTFNPNLELLGVFLTMYDVRTKLSSQVREEAKGYFGKQLLETIIPRSIKLSEAPSYGESISQYAPGSAGSTAYKALALEVNSLCEKITKASIVPRGTMRKAAKA